MNGKKAKKIRKKIYGDFSHRSRNYVVNDKGMLLNTGKRQQYLIAKSRLRHDV